ncbi:MAG TPA: hypothetical protein VF021_05975 [Longimicrobiales bacterium]
MTPAQRIEQIVTGVIAHALLDAHESHCRIDDTGPAAGLVRTWCERTLGKTVMGADGLRLHAASKTALLLGYVPPADVLPLGDLYHSQVVELAGSGEFPEPSAELAAVCGGAASLDRALEQYYDRRMTWPAATAHLNAQAVADLGRALDAARFRRARMPLIPKLGGRTLGIDLYA